MIIRESQEIQQLVAVLCVPQLRRCIMDAEPSSLCVLAETSPNCPQHVASELIVCQLQYGGLVGEQDSTHGLHIFWRAPRHGFFNYMAAVTVNGNMHEMVLLIIIGATHCSNDTLAMQRQAMFQNGLDHEMAKRMSAKARCLHEELVDEIDSLSLLRRMLEEADDHAATKPMPRDLRSNADEFLRDETGEARWHNLDNMRDHEVRMRRLDGMLHVPVQLEDKLFLQGLRQDTQRELHDAATKLLLREGPHHPAQNFEGLHLRISVAFELSRELGAFVWATAWQPCCLGMLLLLGGGLPHFHALYW